MPLEEWTQKEKDGILPEGDYDVTAILDERRRPHARAREYIVKWKASRCHSYACNILILTPSAAAGFGCRFDVGFPSGISCGWYPFP